MYVCHRIRRLAYAIVPKKHPEHPRTGIESSEMKTITLSNLRRMTCLSALLVKANIFDLSHQSCFLFLMDVFYSTDNQKYDLKNKKSNFCFSTFIEIRSPLPASWCLDGGFQSSSVRLCRVSFPRTLELENNEKICERRCCYFPILVHCAFFMIAAWHIVMWNLKMCYA